MDNVKNDYYYVKRILRSVETLTKYPKKILGYKDNEIANPKDMNEYYSDDNINKYGALAIEISLF